MQEPGQCFQTHVDSAEHLGSEKNDSCVLVTVFGPPSSRISAGTGLRLGWRAYLCVCHPGSMLSSDSGSHPLTPLLVPRLLPGGVFYTATIEGVQGATTPASTHRLFYERASEALGKQPHAVGLGLKPVTAS